jgi:hypothetical protein
MKTHPSEALKGRPATSMDKATVEAFGLEWSVYNQRAREPESIRASFR